MEQNESLPLTLVIIGLSILIFTVLLVFRPRSTVDASTSAALTQVNEQARIIVNNNELTKDVKQLRPLAWNRAYEINPSNVTGYSRKNNQYTLEFSDGSVKRLSPNEFPQLPSQLRLRMTYEAAN